MTNVNHNPSNDFPIGSLGMDNAEDTEGHVHGRLGEADEVNHRLEEADTEGHVHGRLGEADEVTSPRGRATVKRPRGGRHRRSHQALSGQERPTVMFTGAGGVAMREQVERAFEPAPLSRRTGDRSVE